MPEWGNIASSVGDYLGYDSEKGLLQNVAGITGDWTLLGNISTQMGSPDMSEYAVDPDQEPWYKTLWGKAQKTAQGNVSETTTGTPGFSQPMAEASTQGEGTKVLGMTQQDMGTYMGKYDEEGKPQEQLDEGKNEAVQRFLQSRGEDIGRTGVDKIINQGGATQTAWQNYLGKQIKEKIGEDNSTPEMRTPTPEGVEEIKPVEVVDVGQQEEGDPNSRMELMLKEYEADMKEQKQFARRRSILDAVNKAKPQGSRFSFRR